jgi:TetR/AcrR family transcriptional regulator, transcriptional repressor for nem operon
MRVSREQAAANKERILDVAAKLFRERGFNGIGVADLMQEAGLTHGGFYGHFASKEDLEAQACARVVAESPEKWAAMAKTGRDPWKAMIRSYLTPAHRDAPGKGCLFAALATDASRQGPGVRGAVTKGLGATLAMLARFAPGRTAAKKREKAVAALASLVGALVLARAVDDPALSEEILRATAASL